MKYLLLLSALLVVVPPARAQDDATARLTELAETERAFSRKSVAVGIRESFYAFFAPDGVVFRPQPVRYHERYHSQPAPPERPPFRLTWWPVFVDVSAAGDLGISTGPSVFEDTTSTEPPGYGYFFSVWQKQPDGTWKVRADIGTSTAAKPADVAPAFRPPVPAPATPADAGTVKALEQRLAAEVAAAGLTAFGSYADAYTRLHRQGLEPVVGAEAVRAFLAQDARRMKWTPEDAGMAASGDLGFSYGAYTLEGGDAAPEKGYYLHVWRRGEDGAWRLAASVHNPEA